MANLRIPGPTPLPPLVIRAISQQVINHRGHEYERIQARVTENLKIFFQTTNDIFLLTSSGMGGLECAIANFFSSGDTIVAFTCGEFGDRWVEIAKRYGAIVKHVQVPLGHAVTKEFIKENIQNVEKLHGVLFTHNETSTGVLNQISDFNSIVKQHPSRPLLLVDSISALGAVDLPMDKLGIDVLVTASQKAWMAPPGIAMIAVSSYAWEKHSLARMPRYYFDLGMYKEFAQKNQTPATCAVTTIIGLDAALQLMKKEGREMIFQRHRMLTKQLREGVSSLGLELFVNDHDASCTVTSIKVPTGIDASDWLKLIREKYNVILAGGMGKTKGKIIRVAHMGYVNSKDIKDVLYALENSLKEISK